MVFIVRVHQVVYEFGRRVRCDGVEVYHSRLQVGRFERNHLAKTPKCRTGKFSAEFALQDLCPARYEPDAVFRYHV